MSPDFWAENQIRCFSDFSPVEIFHLLLAGYLFKGFFIKSWDNSAFSKLVFNNILKGTSGYPCFCWLVTLSFFK